MAKGGNLALNVAPQPDGALPALAVASLKEMGRWMSVFGEGIYETVPCAPYTDAEICYTRKKDTLYGFYLYGDEPRLPRWLKISTDRNVKKVTAMRTGEEMEFVPATGCVFVDTSLLESEGAFYAEGFALLYEEPYIA